MLNKTWQPLYLLRNAYKETKTKPSQNKNTTIQKFKNPLKKAKELRFFFPIITFLFLITKLSDKMMVEEGNYMFLPRGKHLVQYLGKKKTKKKQRKTWHKSAGSARIKKYLDKQLVIWKANLLAPAQKSNYSHLGTENLKRD